VAAWNGVVGREDYVWHLGDFARGTEVFKQAMLERLDGHKHLVVDNNDDAATDENAFAKTIDRFYKTKVIHRRDPRRSCEAVEFATLELVDWLSDRLLEPIGRPGRGGSAGRRSCPGARDGGAKRGAAGMLRAGCPLKSYRPKPFAGASTGELQPASSATCVR
jgi:hypothetical protein